MKTRFRSGHSAPSVTRTRRVLLLPLLSLLVFCFPAHARQAAPPQPAAKTYKLVNGQWFDGKGFKRKTLYAAGGLLTEKAPRQVDEVVDLAGGFVVPPFGE